MTTRQALENWAREWEVPLIFADGFDEAIIGLCCIHPKAPVVAYDRDKCIEILYRDAANYGEAVEYFEHNVACAYVGEMTPAFIERIEE